MAKKITEECINCAACEPECPNMAITQGESAFVIDAVKCDECKDKPEGSRCIAVCPNEGTIVQA